MRVFPEPPKDRIEYNIKWSTVIFSTLWFLLQTSKYLKSFVTLVLLVEPELHFWYAILSWLFLVYTSIVISGLAKDGKMIFLPHYIADKIEKWKEWNSNEPLTSIFQKIVWISIPLACTSYFIIYREKGNFTFWAFVFQLVNSGVDLLRLLCYDGPYVEEWSINNAGVFSLDFERIGGVFPKLWKDTAEYLKDWMMMRLILSLTEIDHGPRWKHVIQKLTDTITHLPWHVLQTIVGKRERRALSSRVNFPMRTAQHEGKVRCIANLPNGNIVTASDDGTMKIWDNTKGWKNTQTLAHRDLAGKSLLCLNILPEGHLISGDSDGNLTKWDAPEITFKGHEGKVFGLEILSSGNIVSVSEDKKIKLWRGYSLSGGKWEELITLHKHSGPVFSLAYNPETQIILSGSGDKTIRLWNETGKEITTLNHHTHSVRCLRMLLNTDFVSAGWNGLKDNRGELFVWDGGTLTIKQNFSDIHQHCIYCISTLPNGHFLTGSFDGLNHGESKVWDPCSLEKRPKYSWPGTIGGIISNCVIRDGDVMLGVVRDTSTVSAELVIYDSTMVFYPSQIFPALNDRGCCVSLLQSGKLIFGGCSRGDGEVKIWVPTKEGSYVLWDTLAHGEKRRVFCVKVLPLSEDLISACSEGLFVLWTQSCDGKYRRQTDWQGHQKKVTCIELLSCGDLISGSADCSLKVWTRKGNGFVQRNGWQGHDAEINCLCVVPTLNRCVSGSVDTTLKVWSSLTSAFYARMYGHEGPVVCLAWIPGSNDVVSGSEDRRLIIWDAGSCLRKSTLSWNGHSGIVSELCVFGEGNIIISGSSDGTWKIWDKDLKIPLSTFLSPSTITGMCLSNTNHHFHGKPDLITILLDGRCLVWSSMLP